MPDDRVPHAETNEQQTGSTPGDAATSRWGASDPAADEVFLEAASPKPRRDDRADDAPEDEGRPPNDDPSAALLHTGSGASYQAGGALAAGTAGGVTAGMVVAEHDPTPEEPVAEGEGTGVLLGDGAGDAFALRGAGGGPMPGTEPVFGGSSQVLGAGTSGSDDAALVLDDVDAEPRETVPGSDGSDPSVLAAAFAASSDETAPPAESTDDPGAGAGDPDVDPGEPEVGPGEPGDLFTDGNDTVDFATISVGQFDPDSYYDALGGDDHVVLPSSQAAADAAGYDLTRAFDAGGGDDEVTGSRLADELYGGAGDDVLRGGGGDDVLQGGDGADSLRGDSGDDIIDGDAGADTLFGGSGHDVLDGGEDADRLDGGSDDDTLRGGGGDDVLTGGAGSDSIDGGAGTDTTSYATHATAINADLQAGRVRDGDGDVDRLTSVENVIASEHDDTLRGSTGSNTLDGRGGDDTVYGGDGRDVLAGGRGDDRLDGGRHDDTLLGGRGDDTLIGGDGNDVLQGGSGWDTGFGGAGNDLFVLDARSGQDSFDGGRGWTDSVELSADAAAGNWTVELENGDTYNKADLAGQDELLLDQDSSGSVTLQDGTELTFENLERIEW